MPEDVNTVPEASPETNPGPLFVPKPKADYVPGRGTPEPAEAESAPPQDVKASEPSADDKQATRRKPDAETRIRDLNTKNRELELRLERLMGREEGRKPEPSPAASPKEELLTEPDIDKFDSMVEYDKANRAYLKQEMKREMAEELDKRESKAKGKSQEEQDQADFVSRYREDSKVTPELTALLAEAKESGTAPKVSKLFEKCYRKYSQSPAKLAVYLLKNPEESIRLNEIKDEAGMGDAIARIEVGKLTTAAKPPAKKLTSALPPPEQVDGTSSGTKDAEEAARERGDVAAVKRLSMQRRLREMGKIA